MDIPKQLSQVVRAGAHMQFPGYRRTLFLRRVFVVVCIVLVVLLSWAQHHRNTEYVVQYARDMQAGEYIEQGDLQRVAIAPDAAVAAVADPAQLIGAILVQSRSAGSLAYAGDVLDQRFQTAEDGATGKHFTPLRIADSALSELIFPGDIVDVIAAGSDTPAVIAVGATVVFVSHQSDRDAGIEPGVVLLALAPDQAALVAATALQQELNVVVTGARTQPYSPDP